jgi:2-dehydro-3-deoxygluconokinase
MAHLTDRQRFDLICVGDTATDIYIALDPERVRIRTEPQGQWLMVPFGAKVPFERTLTVEAGGNAANVAVGCARLELRTALASYLGADQLGREMLSALHGEGVDTSLVRLDRKSPTNQHFVLWLGDERTILVHHVDYDYQWPHLRPSEVPAWLYLSSVGTHAHAYEEQIADWLEENPSVRLAFEPGTHQIEEGAAALGRLYRRASLLLCNRDEAATITGTGGDSEVDVLLSALLDLGPRIVVVTDSVAGAYAAEGAERYHVPSYPDAEPIVDRTGAGDAFSATLLAYLVRGLTLEEALARAPINAMSVVHAPGTQAGLLRDHQISSYLASAPSGYGVRVTHAPLAGRS